MATAQSVVIYSPPKAGLPYLVVTIANGEIVDTVPVASRDAARAVIAQRSRPVSTPASDTLRH